MSGALAGKVAIVTGSTRGIGRGIAARFATEGARVIVNGRKPEDVQRVAEEIGFGALGIAADVADSAQAARLIADAVAKLGRIDVLVNNAGIALDNFLPNTSDERWRAVLDTNLSGPLYLMRAAVPVMRAQGGGAILNIVSWSGLRGNVGQAAYSASKAGLHGLTLSMAKELGKFGIRVNALAPAVPTEMAAEMPEELKEKARKRRALKIDGTVDDVAEGALFLVSDRARFTTGQVLHVDGGLHLN
ncbi:MAG TPA: glucose 1-dehydrogenase [Myxococcota bacterium]|nr:glucose 1-dehydrogenase [Myxococcota bacterium]